MPELMLEEGAQREEGIAPARNCHFVTMHLHPTVNNPASRCCHQLVECKVAMKEIIHAAQNYTCIYIIKGSQ